MSERAVEIERRGAVAWVWMNRPEVHNAFNAAMIAELTAAFAELGSDADVRAVVLAGRGRSFSAGGDAEWMREQGAASVDENVADARRLAELFRTIADLPQPTLARVQGAAIGGGVGLLAACDVAIGASTAVFATSEVRLGLIPATVGPYVLRAIGERQARRLFATGERIDAATAERIGLLHEAVAPEHLDQRVDATVDAVLGGAPAAQREAKKLIDAVAGRAITADVMDETAQWIARLRAAPEAAEGLGAFLEKRKAAWVPQR